jgi:aerobic carbon-monoxide dehydrogenase medium subunit
VPAPAGRRSAFKRLTVRHGAEYSLASLAVSIDAAADGTIAAARVAVGAVAARPVRVPAAERALIGERPGEALGRRAGQAAAEVLDARDGLDAPGWYRLAVLPVLAGRALARLEALA